VLPSHQYTLSSAIKHIENLLHEKPFRERAEKIALHVRSERGEQMACDGIEEVLANPHLVCGGKGASPRRRFGSGSAARTFSHIVNRQ